MFFNTIGQGADIDFPQFGARSWHLAAIRSSEILATKLHLAAHYNFATRLMNQIAKSLWI